MAVYWIKQVSAPSSEPISLEKARLHLRLDTSGSPASHPDDSLVTALITAVRQNAESYTGLTIAYSTYDLRADNFKDLELNLETWPINDIVSISYIDTNQETKTLTTSDYVLDTFTRPARLKAKDKAFPEATEVTIRFTAGFTDGQSPNPYPMPKTIESAMLLMLGNLYDNRESVSNNQSYERPMSATYLLNPHRIKMGL